MTPEAAVEVRLVVRRRLTPMGRGRITTRALSRN
jgi:hypothetical protein